MSPSLRSTGVSSLIRNIAGVLTFALDAVLQELTQEYLVKLNAASVG